jgi:hypothetical protein
LKLLDFNVLCKGLEEECYSILGKAGCHLISSLRMPFEGVFSRKSKRARFIGKVKTQFQAFMEALIFNTRRALVLEIEQIPVT